MGSRARKDRKRDRAPFERAQKVPTRRYVSAREAQRERSREAAASAAAQAAAIAIATSPDLWRSLLTTGASRARTRLPLANEPTTTTKDDA